MALYSIFSGFKLALPVLIPPGYEEMATGQDLVIKFLSAEVCLNKIIKIFYYEFFFPFI